MIRREDFYHALEHDIKPVSTVSCKRQRKILKCDWIFNITSHARVIEQCASFRSVKGQLYFDGDDDDDFFQLVRIPFVIRQIYFYGLLHITFYIPPSCRKKKRENVPLYFVCVKNHTTQIHSSLFHTIQILIQILLSFKPFPLSFALGFWTC